MTGLADTSTGDETLLLMSVAFPNRVALDSEEGRMTATTKDTIYLSENWAIAGRQARQACYLLHGQSTHLNSSLGHWSAQEDQTLGYR